MNSNPPTGSNDDNLIRITRDEAQGQHVDDLLRRQMSLRGETGISRDRRHWYYQNWFVFMLAGLAGAVVAWGLIEPYFDDLDYFQGSIEEVHLGKNAPAATNLLGDGVAGTIQVKGQTVWLFKETRTIGADGRQAALDPATLKKGDPVGVYVQIIPSEKELLLIAPFVKTAPPPQSPSEAAKSFEQIRSQKVAASMLLFPLVAGFIGLAIGGIDGAVCRLFRRALLGGLIGLLVGFVGGFISSLVANVIYTPLNLLAQAQHGSSYGSMSPLGFLLQMGGRGLAWALAGTAMGLGQGIALRSRRMLLYGFLGGVIGGLLGGLLFDPIDMILLGASKPSAHWSRLIGLGVIGATVGAMIGIVELLARDAWLRMTQGPLAGKEFLIFKDVMNLGSSPRSDIYLFNDALVADHHATLYATGDECEIESRERDRAVQINDHPVQRGRLRHGDKVTIGRTMFVFQKRQTHG